MRLKYSHQKITMILKPNYIALRIGKQVVCSAEKKTKNEHPLYDTKQSDG